MSGVGGQAPPRPKKKLRYWVAAGVVLAVLIIGGLATIHLPSPGHGAWSSGFWVYKSGDVSIEIPNPDGGSGWYAPQHVVWNSTIPVTVQINDGWDPGQPTIGVWTSTFGNLTSGGDNLRLTVWSNVTAWFQVEVTW